MDVIQFIHQKAVAAAREYQVSEGRLLEVLIQVESERVFERLGYTSLYSYCVEALRLSEGQSYSLIKVARTSREVPALKEKVASGEIPLSKARRIATVINSENQDAWLEKAAQHTQRELEVELVKAHPESIPPERVRPLTENISELRVAISKELEGKLTQVKDLLAQKHKRHVGMQEALLALADSFLLRNGSNPKSRKKPPSHGSASPG